MKKSKICIAVLLICIMVLVSFPMQAFAAGKIATDNHVNLTINYVDNGSGIPNARFDIFKIGDVDEYANLTLNSRFEKYRGKIEGLSSLETTTGEGWATLASTLSQYVISDGITNDKTGTTDFEGNMAFNGLEPGLYMLFGYGVSTYDYYNYSAIPTMVFLPDIDEAENEWVYDVTVMPKFTKIYDPPGSGSKEKYAHCSVMKVWDDSGYESKRPAYITVHLVKDDGTVFDTKLLNEANGWSYQWDSLDSNSGWYIVEEDVQGYTVTVTRNTDTYIITNKYSPAGVPTSGPNAADPPVSKRITGDKPEKEETFTFVMKADKKSFPMPNGSKDGVKTATIKGAGSTEFGEIVFTEPGVYTYTVSERNDKAKGYSYDSTVYTIRFDVRKHETEVIKDGKTVKTEEIVIDTAFMNEDGDKVDAIEFTNKYRKPGSRLPQTGSLWWPIPVLACIGSASLAAGLICRKREQNEEK